VVICSFTKLHLDQNTFYGGKKRSSDIMGKFEEFLLLCRDFLLSLFIAIDLLTTASPKVEC